MAKELDIGKLFDKLDQPNADDLEKETNRDDYQKDQLIADNLIQTSKMMKKIINSLSAVNLTGFRKVASLPEVQTPQSKRALISKSNHPLYVPE